MIFGGVSDAHTTKNHYMNTTAHHPLPSITIHYHPLVRLIELGFRTMTASSPSSPYTSLLADMDRAGVTASDRGLSMGHASQMSLDLHSIVSIEGMAAPSGRLHPAAIADVQQLLTILAQLHAPDSGWPEALPKTPEAIAPYVAEEVDRVLDWDWSPPSQSAEGEPRARGRAIALSHTASHHLTLEAWLADLLWQVVCSDWTVMQMLEGMRATRSRLDSGQEQSGMVRLIPCLELDGCHPIDLTTYRPPTAWLDPDTSLHIDDARLSEIARVAEQLHTIRDWLSMVPALRSLDGGRIQLLQPGQAWQTVTVALRLGLEFRPYPADERMQGDRRSNMQVQFTQAGWRSQMQTMLVKMQQRQAITDYAGQAIAQPTALEWVRQADELVAHCNQPLWQTHSTVLASAIALDDLNHWLLWNLSRSAKPVMQLLGGVSMRSLQPGHGWQAGTVRLVAALQINTSNRTLAIDLATGQRLTATAMDTSILLQPGMDWTAPAIPVPELLASVQQDIRDRTPVLQLQEPTDIELRDARGDRLGQGTLQLQLFLEWAS